MEKLTQDVLINIFIRLPAKQLVKMRRVCKPWNAFLSESSFIKSHLNHSIRNKHNNEIVMAFNAGVRYRKHVFSCTVYDLSQSPIIELNDLVKLPRNFPQSALNKYGGYVIGSVNGLICFYVGYHDSDVQGIYIWNPSLSVVMTLPPFFDQEELTDPTIHTRGYRYEFRFGFGFDPKTDDYKVVKLTKDWFYDESDSDDELDREKVEVYSMKKGSWEDVTRVYGVCIDDYDGHLHWLCTKVDDIQTIVAFDMGVKSFRQIPLPDSIAIHYRYNVLGMLAGKLCVVSYTPHDGGKYEVWMMNEYGVARDSWVKSHVLSKLEGKLITPLGFTLNNKFLFRDDSQGLSGSYDQETDKVTYFGSDTGRLARVVPYVDSLVWYAAPTN